MAPWMILGCAGVHAVAADDIVAYIDRRIDAWQPTKAEKLFDDIGWVTGICQAQKLAKEHNRPVFLFTHDGRMNIGRC